MNRLSSEWLYRLVEESCKENGVSFDYCYRKMVKLNPKTHLELANAIDRLLAWAYFNDYYALYDGIIPFQECNAEKAIKEAENLDREIEARKAENLN